MTNIETGLSVFDNLRRYIQKSEPFVIAVSGGVDSMTLAHFAHSVVDNKAKMVHAVSSAVPQEATSRLQKHANYQGWSLACLDAGEFRDESYISNPSNRCFYCKKNLYARISEEYPGATIFSGTNIDDLSDYRPGLVAANARAVQHPFVEVNMDKKAIRKLARSMGLESLSNLPASPCLSSRVETGIRIEKDKLEMIDAVESMLARSFVLKIVRCRVRRQGIVIELDPALLAKIDKSLANEVLKSASKVIREHGCNFKVSIEAYRMGSAFLKNI